MNKDTVKKTAAAAYGKAGYYSLTEKTLEVLSSRKMVYKLHNLSCASTRAEMSPRTHSIYFTSLVKHTIPTNIKFIIKHNLHIFS